MEVLEKKETPTQKHLFEEVEGDLIKMAQAGCFDVIVHGCNCFCTMGAGIAPQMAKAFAADEYQYEDQSYAGDINKLGTIDYGVSVFYQDGNQVDIKSKTMADTLLGWKIKDVDKIQHRVVVVNAYTQFGFGANHENGTAAPVDYAAMTLVFKKLNQKFKGKHIGMPLIGCGLAGGDWMVVRDMARTFLKDCDVTVVHYKP